MSTYNQVHSDTQLHDPDNELQTINDIQKLSIQSTDCTGSPQSDSSYDKKTIQQIIEQDSGGNGKFQIRLYIFFCLHVFCVSLFLMIPGWLFNNPDFVCGDNECEHNQFCNYNGIKEITSSYASITSYFQLYCQDEYLNSIGKTLPYLGSMFGLLLLMPYADNKGRKKSIILSWGLFTFGIGLTILVEQIYIVLLGLFLAGFAATPILNLEQIYLNEITSGKFKSISLSLLYVIWSIAELFIYPLTFYYTDWRTFIFYFLFIPIFLLNSFAFFMIESPLFMINKNLETTINILNKIQKINIKQSNITKQLLETSHYLKHNQNNQKYNFTQLFKFKSLRFTTIMLIIISMGGNAALYGIQFSLNIIGSDFGQNSFYAGIADLLGYLLANILTTKLKRKNTNIISLSITSTICMSFMFFSDCQNQNCWQQKLQIVLIMISRLSISIFTSFLALWRTELYPTSISSIGIGFVGALGIIGAQIIPFFEFIGDLLGISQIAIIGIFCNLTCLAGFFLKETYNKKQQNQIQEIINQKQKQYIELQI